MDKETIASIITPIGEGGIGVVLVSGGRALEIVNSIFNGKRIKDLKDAESKRLYYGEICENGITIDEVIVNILRKKDSFTGEDLVEINGHGGIQAVKKVLKCVISAGAKEVSQDGLSNRSFINGKIDLIQEEAIREIPQAKTKLCAKVLLDQYNGTLSSFIKNLIIKVENSQNIGQQLLYIQGEIRKLLETAPFGRAITSPQRLVIVGKPNVGKSTLINALLRETRSIVHKEPGTTSDSVDSLISIDGIPFTIVDTAGIRETNHSVEKLGVSESKRQLKQADKIMFILDGSRPVEKEDNELMNIILDRLKMAESDDNYQKVKVYTILNKTDLPQKLNLSSFDTNQLFNPIYKLSAIKGDGLLNLEKLLIEEFKEYIRYKPETPIIFTMRQQKYISGALALAEKYSHMINDGKVLDDIKLSLSNCIWSS